MVVKCSPKSLSGTIGAISSKSDVHRLLICAALSSEITELHCNIMSKDIKATAACLRAMGAEIKAADGVITVVPSAFSRSAVLDCGESGSTLRFLLPVLSALGINAEIHGHGRLPERPLSPLKEEMERMGAVFETGSRFPLCISGRLEPGEYTLAGNVSSQFISGLLFALPLLSGDSTVRLIPPVESRSYLNITAKALEKFGIEITEKENLYIIKGNQKYRSPGAVTADGDWSNSAFFLSAGALSENGVTVTGLDMNSPQGDKKILDVLKSIGAQVTVGENFVTVKKNKLFGTETDASDIPDLVPAISALSAFCGGRSVIKNAGRLRIKECDRLRAMKELLTAAGIKAEETPDGLIIYGGKTPASGTIESFNDHRIAMAAAVLSCGCSAPVTICGAEAVDKSYPSFFEDFNSLGGNANVVNDGK